MLKFSQLKYRMIAVIAMLWVKKKLPSEKYKMRIATKGYSESGLEFAYGKVIGQFEENQREKQDIRAERKTGSLGLEMSISRTAIRWSDAIQTLCRHLLTLVQRRSIVYQQRC